MASCKCKNSIFAGCGRAGLAGIHGEGSVENGDLVEFFPHSVVQLPLPEGIPAGIENEFREAEKDASIESFRSGSAMLRSALEKTLKAHGYTTGNLESKVDKAADDGVITLPLKRRAHENVRVLGNNILHDEWRAVDEEEFEAAHEYTRRVLECFYDDPETVKAILIEKGNTVETENEEEPKKEEVETTPLDDSQELGKIPSVNS
ncbi:DUF4145 domain-containing protein [Candidatus Daviesbacteria bacterium]|nr:DUF4145 domain-containing protein [Candidatus Daviesbacteria bacterium]